MWYFCCIVFGYLLAHVPAARWQWLEGMIVDFLKKHGVIK